MAKGTRKSANTRSARDTARDNIRRNPRNSPVAGGHKFDVSRALDRLAEQLPEINRTPRTLVAPPAPVEARPVIRSVTKPVSRSYERQDTARRAPVATRSAVADFKSRPTPTTRTAAAASRTAPARSNPSPVAAATRQAKPAKRSAPDAKKTIVRKCDKRPSDTRSKGGSRSYVPWNKKPC